MISIKRALLLRLCCLSALQDLVGWVLPHVEIRLLKLINYSYGYKPIGMPHFGQVHVS